MYKRIITIHDLIDFQNAEQQGIAYVAGSSPTVGQWTYDSSLNVVKANADRGYFRFYTGKVAVGDKIKIKAEIYNVSGVKTHSSIDFSQISNSGFEAATSGLNSTTRTSDWELIDFEYVSPTYGEYSSVVFGLSTGEIGVYQLRNVQIEIDSIYPGRSNDIIDSGSNANGTWIKYSDGTMICTQQYSFTIACSSVWGALFTTGDGTGIPPNFPVAFVGVPIVTKTPVFTVGGGNFFLMTSATNPTTATNAGSAQCVRGSTSASLAATINIVAIGKWK